MASSLKEIERKTYILYFEDGIWDLFIGFIFLFLGLGFWFHFDLISLMPVLLVFFPVPLKRRITMPRIGHIHITKSRSMSVAFTFYGVFFGLLTGILVLGMVNPSNSPLIAFFTQNLMLLIGAVVALAMTFTAYYMHYQHLHLYALLTFLAFAVMRWWGSLAGVSLTVVGVVALVIGTVTMVRFIQKHPIAESTEQNSVLS